MDAIVTARVPLEVKEQVNIILKEIDSSPTKLINAAYEYVLRYHDLPRVVVEYDSRSCEERDELGRSIRYITQDMRTELDRLLSVATLEEPAGGWDTRDYRYILAEGKREDYEALG